MNEQEPPPTSSDKRLAQSDAERTKRVTAAGWTAGASAFFLVGALTANGSWPMATGVIAIAAMVATACYCMLKQP